MVAESFSPGLAGLFDSKEHLLRATAYPTQSASVMGSLEGKDRMMRIPGYKRLVFLRRPAL